VVIEGGYGGGSDHDGGGSSSDHDGGSSSSDHDKMKV